MSSPANVPESQIKSAVEALLKYVKSNNEDSNQLFDVDSEMLTVQFGLREIPAKEHHKMQRIELPHPFWTGSEVCVFVKDDMEDRGKREHEVKRKLWKNLVKKGEVEAVGFFSFGFFFGEVSLGGILGFDICDLIPLGLFIREHRG